MTFKYKYGTTDIDYTIEYSDRKTLSIEVYPSLDVNVIAPFNATAEEIEKKIIKRASWIVKQRKYFESFLPRIPEREYVSGETHLYLGRKYVLKVNNGLAETVKLKAGNIIITTNNTNPSTTKRLLGSWYYKHSQKRFNIILQEAFSKFNSYNLEFPEFEIKRMKNRWGSCTPAGKIIINPEIIKAPSKSIEYVIIHEVCHLIHPNHSKEFFQLLEEKMPDWEKWKIKLELLLA